MLHRRFSALMVLAALVAFLSGARGDAPSGFIALAVVAVAAVQRPGTALSARLEPAWRLGAVLLAARALYAVVFMDVDVVLPMVDLLLLLLCVETLRPTARASDGRLYSLSLALLVAASAYRPGVLFLVAFVAYVVFGTVSLVAGQVARDAVRHRVRHSPLPAALVWRTALLALVPLATAALVFATFPRAARGLMTRPAAVQQAVIGFSEEVSLGAHGSRLYPNPAVALRVEFPDGVAGMPSELYWRGRSYDRFDGIRWSRTRALATRAQDQGLAGSGPAFEQLIYGVPLQAPVLFGLNAVEFIAERSRIRVVWEPAGDYTYVGNVAPIYTVISRSGPPDAARIAAIEYAVPAGLAAYLQMPPLSPRVHALADSLGAGHDGAWERAVALERWFHEAFSYTLDLPRTEREATLEHFLFQRRAGHCEYFSTAMVMLLRAQGIAARNVNGFLGGEWNEFGSFLTVTQNQAHSWVEAWFPGAGWVRFDPTPAALGMVAAQRRGWLSPFRFLADGLEHRWSKWVLDYDIEKQTAFVRRSAEALSNPVRGEAAGEAAWLRLVGAGALGIALVLVAVRMLPALRRRRDPVGHAAAVYLRLQRAYRRAGYAMPAATPPYAFGRALVAAGAPGAAAADAAIRQYAALRFGRPAADADARRAALDATAAEALRALRGRAVRNGWPRPLRGGGA
jgi:protein-glutamine gamma-glutamyltransferase